MPNVVSNTVGVVSINDGASNNVIGGSVPGSGNVISGNNVGLSDGVDISGSGTDYNRVQGNFIGVDQSGNVALGNGAWGVRILSGAQFNVIGVDSTNNVADGNVISGNAIGGVAITSANGLEAISSDNVVAGNLIGLGADGSTTVGNGIDGGIGIWQDASGNIIGGTTAADRNVISGNGGVGIVIGNGDGTSGNVIEGNYIGTDATGMMARPNSSSLDSLQAYGVFFYGAGPNTLGGTTPGARNVISGNDGVGVFLSSGTTGVQIEGNYIGVDATGTAALANTGVGIQIGSLSQPFEGDSSDNTIGGTAAGAGNEIAYNDGPGVAVMGTNSTGNSIEGNSIHNNTPIGIGLGGTTFVANDSQGHTGPNLFQDYPIVQSATISSNGDLVVGYSVPTADTSATYPLVIDFYLADPTGQGETYLASNTYSTTDLANGIKSVDLGSAAALGVAPGDALVATATDAAGNTSEFSPLTTGAVVPTMADQTITFAALANQTYGVAPFTVGATASSGLPVSFAILSGPATVSGDTLTVTGAGTVVVAALQAGNGNYYPAPAVDQSFTVAKATLTVTANYATKVFDTANPTFTDTVTGFVNNDPASVVSGSASLTTTATTTSPVGTWTITAAQGTLSAANYTFAFVNGTLSITLAPAGDTSVYVLSPSAASALSLSGNAQVQVSGPVDVDSSSSSAISVSGNAEVTAGSIAVVGHVQSSGNAHLSPGPVTGAGSFGDPLANLAVPSVSGSKSSVSLSGNGAAADHQPRHLQPDRGLGQRQLGESDNNSFPIIWAWA